MSTLSIATRHGVEVGALVRMDDDAAEGRGLLHKVVHPAAVAARRGRLGLDLAKSPRGCRAMPGNAGLTGENHEETYD